MDSHFVFPKLLPIFFLCLVDACYGAVLFSSLPQALLVSASSNPTQVLTVGKDRITVTWSLNPNSTSLTNNESYKYIKTFLCYAPLSQVDRPWRKSSDKLSKDKTCQFTLFSRGYDSSVTNKSVNWMITRDIPSAAYFIRVYAYNSNDQEVAYGQTSDAKKTQNIFEIKGITGIDTKLEVLSICGSVFPLVSLVGLMLRERNKRKTAAKPSLQ